MHYLNRMLSRRRFLEVSAFTGGGLCLSGVGALAQDEIARLYEDAKQEGAVSYYAGGPIAPHQADIEAFSKEFPGISFDLKTGFSNQLVPPINDQIAAGKLEADIANLQTIQDIEAWRQAEVLASYRSPNFDAILDTFKEEDGTSVGVHVYGLCYGYNPNLVAAEDVPKSAPDFLDSKFRGKIISTYPQDDDITLYLYWTIVDKYGWEYMSELMKNQPRFIRGHLGIAQEIAAGNAALSFDASVTTITRAQAAGGTIEAAFSQTDPMPIWDNRLCIFKDAPHPNAARLFQTWLLSREHQIAAGLWSTRRDVEPEGGKFKGIDEYFTAHNFKDFILQPADELQELRVRFESFIGPVEGMPVLSAPAKN